jgi:periplasmic protein TonB
VQEAATSILIGRNQQADGLNRMVVWSLAVHSMLLLAIVLMPRDWLRIAKEQEAAPMMISLGPAGQADTGGMTAITSAPVQRAEPEAKPVNTPPAPKAPEMTIPEPDLKPKPVLKPVDKPLDKSAAKKPTVGPEVKSGAARAQSASAAQVPFGGLADQTGGSATGGVRTDVANFCCPEYIDSMTRQIRSNWDQRQGAFGMSVIRFTIRRDGMLTNVEVDKTSGNQLLDFESRRAVLQTRQLSPLPDRFDRPALTVYITFDYKR